MDDKSDLAKILEKLQSLEKLEMQDLINLYQDDLPSPGSINSQAHTWRVRWEQHRQGSASVPSTLADTLQETSETMFPNIMTLHIILSSLAVTSCSAERSFSGLKRLKFPMRSTMGNERLTGMSLLHMHRDIPINISDVITTFAQKNPRRMNLENVLLNNVTVCA